MNTETNITNIDDKKLVHYISHAQNRIVYMAPGITDQVAHALSVAWMRLGTHAVHVIVDVEPEVCRLGYGTLDGLKTVLDQASKLHAQVCQQPGVRIGLLIADNTTIVYSPTPLLIEAGSTQPEHPNAIQLHSIPNEIAEDMGLEASGKYDRSIGEKSISSEDIEKTESDLKANPPAKFDLARKVRVFTSRFQFVEFEMTGCMISRKKVPIPSNLVGLANDRNLQNQFHAHFDLINRNTIEVKVDKRILTENSLRKKKDDIRNRFLIPLKGYGNVILHANKDQFLEAVDELKKDVEEYQRGIKKDLQKHMDQNAESLVEALLPAVLQRPPDEYKKFFGVDIPKNDIKEFLARDIKDAFGKSEDLVQNMNVKVIFKNLTYESLKDEKFLEIARESMPNVDIFHDEYDAAKAVDQ
ncbi:MAG: hypothetical protein C4527_01110 [Candidatus Omnitrophota bacterium]|jgi:hypothetical protein|nr:MAG: hypothetical protein C4527_01110 [Candidatus Omnitrophota bacterium]